MASSPKIINCSRLRPPATLKKNGVVWNRFVFTGQDTESGAERLFFIELEFLNAGIAQDAPVLGFQTSAKISEEDLQYALAGTKAAHDFKPWPTTTPSYVAVRVGAFGQGAKQICAYHLLKNVAGAFRLSPVEAGGCIFADDRLSGAISCTDDELMRHPEYLCSAGEASWDLYYKIQYAFPRGCKEKAAAWFPLGAKTQFQGIIAFCGREYRVVPKSSCGYIDLNFARALPAPWFHLSSSNLTSRISGKTLFDSCFAAQGLYDGRIALSVKLEDVSVIVKADKSRHAPKTLWFCNETPADEEGEKLHWSLSADTKKWVVDIDIMCATQELFVRDIELPEGSRKVMKLLGGGTGTGQIRLYRHVGKNLEIIEDAHVAGALCEYGQIDAGEE